MWHTTGVHVREQTDARVARAFLQGRVGGGRGIGYGRDEAEKAGTQQRGDTEARVHEPLAIRARGSKAACKRHTPLTIAKVSAAAIARYTKRSVEADDLPRCVETRPLPFLRRSIHRARSDARDSLIGPSSPDLSR